MKTVNRGWLKKKVEKGEVEAKCNYRHDPQFDNIEYGSDRWIPARLSRCHGDFMEGEMNFKEWDFRSKSGCAWKNPDGTITLIIHSNSSYELRLVQ